MQNIYINRAFLKFLLILCLWGLIPSFLLAQRDGQIHDSTTNDSTVIRSGDDFFNAVEIGVIFPQGSFSQHISNPGGNTYDFNNLTLPFKGQDGLGARTGANLQYQGYSNIYKINIDSNKAFRFGIQHGFDFAYIPLDWSNVQWGNYNLTVGTSPFLYMGFKVGPAFYYTIAKNFGIGVYGMIDPYITAPGGEQATYVYTDALGNRTVADYSVKDTSNFHGNIDISAGINIYYKAFIVGVEYNWIHTRYNGLATEYESDNKSANSFTTTTSSFEDILHLNIIKVTIGVRLGYGGKGDARFQSK